MKLNDDNGRRMRSWRVAGIALAAVVLFCGALTGCGKGGGKSISEGAGGKQKLTIGMSVNDVVFASVYVADQMGFFEKEGLEVDLRPFKGGSALQAAFASGDIEVAGIGASSAIRANAAVNQDIKFIMSFQAGVPYDVIVSKRIKSWQDLKGKALAITKPGSQTELITRALLEEHGLDPDKDVDMISTGGDAEQAAALKTGSADATVVSAASKNLIKLANGRLLQASEDIKVPMQTNGLGVTQGILDEHPDVAKKTVRALMRAAAAMHDPKQEQAVKDAFEKGLGESDPKALQEWWEYVSSDPERVFPVAGDISKDGVANVLKLVEKTEPKAADLTVDDVVDDSIIRGEAKLARSLEK